ncbi:MAG: helix-turn-helix domain-containing protein [Bacteroidetes bacterium]|nr:helix-turn-helix domain-containing protein [Bacteroidota bacterium]
MDILKKIKLIRRIKGLTQLDMSEKIGISLNNYNRLENGVNDLSYKRLSQISDIFEMKVSEVIDFEEETGKDLIIKELKKENIELKNYNTALKRGLKKLYEKNEKGVDFESFLTLMSTIIDDSTVMSVYNDSAINIVKKNAEIEDEDDSYILKYHENQTKKHKSKR